MRNDLQVAAWDDILNSDPDEDVNIAAAWRNNNLGALKETVEATVEVMKAGMSFVPVAGNVIAVADTAHAIHDHRVASAAFGMAMLATGPFMRVVSREIRHGRVVEFLLPGHIRFHLDNAEVSALIGLANKEVERSKRFAVLAPTIRAGKITREQVQALYDSGWLKSKNPRALFPEKLKAFLGLARKPRRTQAHHDLPVALEFELRFLQAGLDPNLGEFGRFINKARHATWSQGKGFVSGGPFNQAWRQFFGKKPRATASEILEFMHELRSGVPQTLRKTDGSSVVWTFQ